MSWSLKFTGSKDEVKAYLSDEMGKISAKYSGKPEEADIFMIHDRLVALVDDCDLGEDSYGTNWNAVEVSASGSHALTCRNCKGFTHVSASFSISRCSV